MPRRLATSLLVLAAACGGPPPVTAPVPTAPLPDDVRWVRTSAEYRAIALQVYRNAGDAVLAAAADRLPGTWAVILDADETVLDNSEHERRIVLAGVSFSDSTWAPWVRERAAPAIPGAVEFIATVQRAGGVVAIVTNRADSLCADTRTNLEAAGVHADMVLCKPPGGSDKNPRFEAVAHGTAQGSPRPLTVLAWVGDNIHDFPGRSQADRDHPAALAPFGERWFVLPNPMYGSWQRP
jgi:acid phosphatase